MRMMTMVILMMMRTMMTNVAMMTMMVVGVHVCCMLVSKPLHLCV